MNVAVLVETPVLGGDPRFRLEHIKFFFTPADQETQIPIETLVLGDLGLPRKLSVIRPGNGMYQLYLILDDPS